jgi:ParB-like chromosome segregation protein Spo0J
MKKEIQDAASEFKSFLSLLAARFPQGKQEEVLQVLQEEFNALKGLPDQPISNVMWVDVNRVVANDYNPNSVASKEMKLLEVSILQDGYTQPVVTVYDEKTDKYVIVDGFHRTTVMKTSKRVQETTGGKLPIVVLKKEINDRMAATVRHNRARGSHSVDGMSTIVFEMLENGWQDHDICNQMGMEADELVRLKHITGFSKLFADTKYSQEWKNRSQLLLEKQYRQSIENAAHEQTTENIGDDTLREEH